MELLKNPKACAPEARAFSFKLRLMMFWCNFFILITVCQLPKIMVIAVCDLRLLKTAIEISMSATNILSFNLSLAALQGGQANTMERSDPAHFSGAGHRSLRRAPAKPGGSSGGTPHDPIGCLQFDYRAEEPAELPPPPQELAIYRRFRDFCSPRL